MKKPLIVGQAPNRTGDPKAVLRGRCGRFLERLAGLKEGELPKRARLANLFDEWPGSKGSGDDFSMDDACERAMRFHRDGRKIVMLGRNVAKAFRLDFMEWFSSFKAGRALFVLIPHPSGRNRMWNDPANRLRASLLLRPLLRRRKMAK